MDDSGLYPRAEGQQMCCKMQGINFFSTGFLDVAKLM